tara:strand:+ start:2365 stop:3687 length:1323 start_codon:yes stop_codon:yes gene_type:complete
MKNKKMLEEVQKFVDHLNTTNSSNEKMEILKQYDNQEIKDILFYTYNPFITYGITSKKIAKEVDVDIDFILMDLGEYTLADVLNLFRSRTVTGDAAVALVQKVLSDYSEHESLILKIIDRDLETRVGVKNYNKVYKNCIPTFDCALAKKYEDKFFAKMDADKTVITRKLDGLRCIMIAEDGKAKFYSRSGKIFTTLGKVEEAVNKQIEANPKLANYVIDGEICIVDEDGNEDFKAISKVYNKKDYTIENPKFKMFDFIRKDSFENGMGFIPYCDRLDILTKTYETNEYLDIVESWSYSEENLAIANKLVKEKGWEGLMLRDGVYEGKRTSHLLKLKKFIEEEFTVIGASNADFRVISKETGLEITVEGLANITIDLGDGESCESGSGFTQKEREYYVDKHEELIGSEVTIQYFEKSENSKGEKSLRFPTIKVIHNGKRDN